MEQFSVWLSDNPIVAFTIFLLASLTVPPLVERLRLPGLVGLLLAGIILGPHGLRLLEAEGETVKLLSDIGKVYLMFVAGLEIDMQAFRKTRNRSLTFGMLTFAVPMLAGIGVGVGFNMGWTPSILIGSLLASHTLLGYPIVQRLGRVRNEAVTITVGATIFTDIGALLVLAVCVSIHQGEFTWVRLILQLAALALYATIVLLGLDWLGRAFFRRTVNDEGNQFLFILLALFLSSVGAQVVHTENIVGAFLAGLAVNDVLGKGAVKEKVEFVGGVLFIPFFFIAMGLLIDVPMFLSTLFSDPGIVAAIVLSLIASKFVAAGCVKQIYQYSWPEALTMWSLSLPQVAATLAAALVGYQVGLLSEAVFNSVIVLMLVTSTLGPVLTRRYASQLPVPALSGTEPPQPTPQPTPQNASQTFPQEISPALSQNLSDNLPPKTTPLAPGRVERLSPSSGSFSGPFSVLVPVHNPTTEPYLIDIAGRLVQQHRGRLLPLAIAQPTDSLNDPAFIETMQLAQQQLAQAGSMGEQLGILVYPILRIDRDIAAGICHCSREQSTQLLLMGYGDMITLQARLLGSIVDQVFQRTPCPMVVFQLRCPPAELSRVVVPLWNRRPYLHAQIRMAQEIAAAIEGTITVLYICAPSTADSERQQVRTQIEQGLDSVSRTAGALPEVKVEVVPHSDAAAVTLGVARSTDLIVLHGRDLISPREVAMDHWGETIIQTARCSVALYTESAI
ncbi:MAG: cation:proton antiporter [Cyanobacteria bacterium P01_A01_bin.114]